MANNIEFNNALDSHVKNRIDEILRQNRDYFIRRINAEDMLRYLKDVVSISRWEKIECDSKNHGNTRAVDKLIDEMQKYAKFSWSFLNGLKRSGFVDMVTELLKGWERHAILRSNSTVIYSLIGDQPRYSPPPYDDIGSQLCREQEKEMNGASIHNTPGSVSSQRVEFNRFSSSGTTDQNPSFETTPPSILQPSNTNPTSNPPPYAAQWQENFQAEGSHTGVSTLPSTHDQSSTLRPVSQGNRPEDGRQTSLAEGGILSDVHSTEMMVSKPGEHEETLPKRVGTEAEMSNTSDEFMNGDSGRCHAIVPPCSDDENSVQSSSIVQSSSTAHKAAGDPSTMSTLFTQKEQPSGKNLQSNLSDGKKSVASNGEVQSPPGVVASDAVMVVNNASGDAGGGTSAAPQDDYSWNIVAGVAVALSVLAIFMRHV